MIEIIKKILKNIQIPKRISVTAVLTVAISILTVFVLLVEMPMLFSTNSLAQNVGANLGKMVGLAIGSADAMHDLEDVINDAENKANTPKVTVTVEETFKNVGKLEVLTAEVKTYYKHEKGNYAALYILNGDGVFTVDLSKAQFEIDENIVNIKLPRPALDIRFKDLPKKIAEYEGFDFLVSSDDAYKGYTAAQTELIKNIKDKMVNYHMLLESAENSAKKSMKLLVQSIKGNDVEITIDFTGEGEVHAE